jgi:hypothetical protein
MRIIGIYIDIRFDKLVTKPLKINRFINSVLLFSLSAMEIMTIRDIPLLFANLFVIIVTARYAFELTILIFPVPFYLLLT